MQNGFNSIQENSVEMTLTGLRQEKYIQLFNKKGVTKFDTFINMNEEDLEHVGITDQGDMIKILDGLKPLKFLYKDINEFGPPDLEMVLGNNVHHLRTHLGALILLRRQIVRKKPKNTLIDNTHSAINAIVTLLNNLKTQLEYIESDLSTENMKMVTEDKTKRKIINLVFAGLISSLVSAGIAFIKYYNINPLEKLGKLKSLTL